MSAPKPHLERVMDEARASDDPLVKGLLSELEERLRLNVGILAENKTLKRLETTEIKRFKAKIEDLEDQVAALDARLNPNDTISHEEVMAKWAAS